MNLMFSYHMVLVYVFPLIVAVQYKEKTYYGYLMHWKFFCCRSA